MSEREFFLKILDEARNFAALSETHSKNALEWVASGHLDVAHIEKTRAIVYTHCARRIHELLVEYSSTQEDREP